MWALEAVPAVIIFAERKRLQHAVGGVVDSGVLARPRQAAGEGVRSLPISSRSFQAVDTRLAENTHDSLWEIQNQTLRFGPIGIEAQGILVVLSRRK